MKIEEIDTNFKISTNIEKSDIKFYNVLNEPFKIYGIFMENGKFRRMPEDVAKTVNDGVYALHTNTAGGRVRFKTDSPYVAIHTSMDGVGKMPHFPFTGSAGFDLYTRDENGEIYINSFCPPFTIDTGYESLIEFSTSEMREITINFPLYSNVKELYIGLSEASKLDYAEPYKYEKPVVYYGSSITQGGCASRPGNAYQSMISRRLNCDHINLGFSGSAKAEAKMADYIKYLDMSVFVYDYDHNAPSVEHLLSTHEAMFKAIREKNPYLPVIFMSRPKLFLNDEEKKRFEIIRTTYENAVNSGDKNVWFIPGCELMKMTDNDGTVDNCHPNDLGFASMASVIGDVIKNILEDKYDL